MNTKIKKLLEEGLVDGFFAYKTVRGFFFPHLFTKENMAELEPWKATHARYPIVKLLLAQARNYPERKYGILARGCEERAIHELFKWEQLRRDNVVMVGQACTADLAKACECAAPAPTRVDYGKAVAPVKTSARLKELEAMPEEGRLRWWLSHFNRCLRCHGCRDVCPVCFCTDCSLDHAKLIDPDRLPPDTSFHLVRAVHMGGRCIDCGLCEEACPANIPLRSLYKQVNKLVEEVYDYKPGADDGNSPFTFLGDESLLPPGPR